MLCSWRRKDSQEKYLTTQRKLPEMDTIFSEYGVQNQKEKYLIPEENYRTTQRKLPERRIRST